MLESALIFLVFSLAVFGTIDFAMLALASNFVAYGAGEGARYAIVHGSASGSAVDADDVQTYVRGLAVGLTTNNINVTTTWPVNNNPGSLVTVTVTYSYQPIMFLALKSSIPLTGYSQMVIRQ